MQVPTINEENPRVISCDPGVRTFITGYDPSGQIVTIADRANEKLYRLLHATDVCRSAIDTAKNTLDKQTAKTEQKRIYRNIQNLCLDIHWKVARFLVSNYDIIILPHYRTSEMMKSKKIKRGTKRQMQAFSFYRFKQRLSYLCRKYQKRLVFVEEPFTSQTCGNCGSLKPDLGPAKIYECNHCGGIYNRDENAARNILIRNMGAIPHITVPLQPILNPEVRLA
jgi:putative transposase